MQMAIDKLIFRNTHLKWNICNSNSLEFVVSDNPNGEFIIPITPGKCLICGFDINNFNHKQMLDFNLKAIARSKEYYFVHNLRACINV